MPYPVGQLKGLVRQLSIDQFENEGRRVQTEQKIRSPLFERQSTDPGVHKVLVLVAIVTPKSDFEQLPFTYRLELSSVYLYCIGCSFGGNGIIFAVQCLENNFGGPYICFPQMFSLCLFFQMSHYILISASSCPGCLETSPGPQKLATS